MSEFNVIDGVNKYMGGFAIQPTRRTFAYTPTQLAQQHVKDRFKEPFQINEDHFIKTRQEEWWKVKGLRIEDSKGMPLGLFVFEYPTKYPQPSYEITMTEELSPLDRSKYLIRAFEMTDAPLQATLPLTLPLHRERVRRDLRGIFEKSLSDIRTESGIGLIFDIYLQQNGEKLKRAGLDLSVSPTESLQDFKLIRTSIQPDLPNFQDQPGLSDYQKQAYELAKRVFHEHVLLNGIYDTKKYNWPFFPIVGTNDEARNTFLSRKEGLVGQGIGNAPVKNGSLLDRIVWETLNMDENSIQPQNS